jgi:bis(5'-nucleosyl)-tetraphosphatase (symmetrical)
MGLAAEVEQVLQSPDYGDFLTQMYNNEPRRWTDALTSVPRLLCIVNALTRIRFCTAEGEMEFEAKGLRAQDAPPGFLPWFDVPGRKTSDLVVAFGHWSTLGWLNRPDVLSLDSGCVWGGCLSALRVDGPSGSQNQALIQVKCDAAQQPGL